MCSVTQGTCIYGGHTCLDTSIHVDTPMGSLFNSTHTGLYAQGHLYGSIHTHGILQGSMHTWVLMWIHKHTGSQAYLHRHLYGSIHSHQSMHTHTRPHTHNTPLSTPIGTLGAPAPPLCPTACAGLLKLPLDRDYHTDPWCCSSAPPAAPSPQVVPTPGRALPAALWLRNLPAAAARNKHGARPAAV